VTGGEAFDTGVRIEWFKRLELYAKTGRMCPFDGAATGFYVGEGACAMVLQSEDAVERGGVRPYAEYVGGAFAQQGWKHAIPDVRSNRLADVTRRMLDVAHDRGVEVDLFMPHGAATTISDGYEATCLALALKDRLTDAVAAVYKPHVGHMLASSAVVEVSAGLLAMRHGTLPGTLNAQGGCGKLPVPLVSKTSAHEVRGMMKLSTGFTGHDAAGLYRRVD
jgi:3-oxoacyl-(acyl-carrier-protein) synthase